MNKKQGKKRTKFSVLVRKFRTEQFISGTETGDYVYVFVA